MADLIHGGEHLRPLPHPGQQLGAAGCLHGSRHTLGILARYSSRAAEVTQLRSLTVCRPLRALCDLASANPDAVADLRPIAVEARRRGLITEREVSAMKERKDARKIVATLLP